MLYVYLTIVYGKNDGAHVRSMPKRSLFWQLGRHDHLGYMICLRCDSGSNQSWSIQSIVNQRPTVANFAEGIPTNVSSTVLQEGRADIAWRVPAPRLRPCGHSQECSVVRMHGELPHPRSGPVRHVCDVQARPLRHPRGAQWRRKRGPSAVQDVDPSWPRLEAQSRILQAVRVEWWLVSRRLHEGHHPVDSG
jgi:hypothetical protein